MQRTRMVWAMVMVLMMVISASAQCGWQTTDAGKPVSWDLSSLTKASGGGDYKGSDGAYDYKANVCGASNAGVGCTDKDYTICQYSQATQQMVASLGSFKGAPVIWNLIGNPTPTEPASAGLQYTMTNGDICYIAGRQVVRTVISVFRCAAATKDTIGVKEDEASCIFTITFETPKACQGTPPTPSGGGSSGGMSGGTYFIIIVLSLIPLYIAGGCIYNIGVKKAAVGRESCPHSEFWTAFPGYVKDGFVFTWNMTRSGCKRGQKYDEL